MPIHSDAYVDNIGKPKSLSKVQSVPEEQTIGKLTLLNGSANDLETAISGLETLVLGLGGVITPSPGEREVRSDYSTIAQAVETIPAFLTEIQTRITLIEAALAKVFV